MRAFREQFVTALILYRLRRFINHLLTYLLTYLCVTGGTTRLTVRDLAVLTDFVPLKWHDLARHIAGHCGNQIRASVRAA